MPIRHGVLAVPVVLGHHEVGAAVCDGAGGGGVVELVDCFEGAVGPEHGCVGCIPGCAVGDGDVGEGAVEGEVGVEAKYSAYSFSISLWVLDFGSIVEC